jgi:hypothetical protein
MAHTQFQWKIGVKWLLNIDFVNMSGSSLHSGKMLNESVTFVCHISCFNKMETRPIHIQKSMFNDHFTPICHQN